MAVWPLIAGHAVESADRPFPAPATGLDRPHRSASLVEAHGSVLTRAISVSAELTVRSRGGLPAGGEQNGDNRVRKLIVLMLPALFITAFSAEAFAQTAAP